MYLRWALLLPVILAGCQTGPNGEDASDTLALPATDLLPGSVSSFDVALGHLRAGEYDRAAEAATGILKQYPKNALAYTFRGIANAARGEHERAVADFTRSLALNPNDPETLTNRGKVYSVLGAYDKAIADFDKVLEINPKDRFARIARADVLKAKGDLEGARKEYERAGETVSDDPPDTAKDQAAASPLVDV